MKGYNMKKGKKLGSSELDELAKGTIPLHKAISYSKMKAKKK